MKPQLIDIRLLAFLVIAALALAAGITLTLNRKVDDQALQNSRGIALLLHQYAVDHGGHYPPGQSSTALFQQLLDAKYAVDPALFYVPLPGKVKPSAPTLTPENVSFDVTTSDGPFPDKTPLVFITGYKVSYTPGSAAQPLFQTSQGRFSGLAVTYTEDGAFVARNGPLPNGLIPNFLAPSFNSSGRKLQQLTPTGPL